MWFISSVVYIECDSGGCLQIRLVMKADCQRHFQCDGQLLSADKRQKDKNTKDRSMSHESCLADMKTGSSEKNLKIVEWVKHVQAPIICAFSPLRISNGRPRAFHPGRNLVVTFMNSSKAKVSVKRRYPIIFFLLSSPFFP